MTREIFDEEHEAFRDAVGTFLDKEVVPHHDQWEKDGIVDRDVWAKAGAQGLLGLQLDEEYGGGGTPDFRYNVVIGEEMTRRGVYGAAFPLFNDMIVPYLVASANDEQKQRWFPDLASGEKIAAIAMTEPGAGSDLQGIRTTAVDQGDHYVLNGTKTFISNGILADLVVVVARTDPEAGHKGISLLMVERGMEGFERGRNLDKVGQHAQDTAELSFDNVRVPKENLLGDEGAGLHLPDDQPVAGAALDRGLRGVRVRGDPRRRRCPTPRTGPPSASRSASFQHNRFVIAEMATESHIARVFVDDCIKRHVTGDLDASTASMAKWWTTELQKKLVDQGVQMHGGYGYMMEYPIARAFVNSRVQTIYGGTTEIQKEIIGRSLGI